MEFLRNEWYVAATSAEVEGKPLARTICGEDVVLFRTRDGAVGALEDRCPHRMAPLSRGEVVDGHLQCGYHGALFDSAGACVGIPCQPGIREAGLAYYKATAYPVVEAFSYVFIWLGEPEKADPARLPNWHAHTAPGMTFVHGFHYVKGNYQLLIDNLNDLTHLTFVHKATLGKTGGSAWTEVPIEVTMTDDAVRTSRIMRNLPPSALVRTVRKLSGDERLDRFQTSEFSPPAFVTVVLGAEPPDPQRQEMGIPNHVVLNALTPETETTTHYFWCVTRSQSPGDADVSKAVRDLTKAAFDEDASIIEAQQSRISSAAPGRKLKNFSSDRAVEATRRIIARMVAAQADQSAAGPEAR